MYDIKSAYDIYKIIINLRDILYTLIKLNLKIWIKRTNS